ncbi:ArsR/SmtB family transcription factor [Promicromonospora sp. NPDC050880]|uniref:ArsR/SmtB family transcription factor n=1 Tax=Promicromonospora sp. NPDC050880 TaxID=3364406 RepID=UPI0037A620A1
MPTHDVRTLTEGRAVAALANPARSRLLDSLTAEGPATASVLAERTGLAVGSISHHMKVLASAGLVEEAPDLARDRRERWWRRAARSITWGRSTLPPDAESQRQAVAAEEFMLARQVERARAWLERPEQDDEWTRAELSTDSWLRLTPDELQELTDEVNDLVRRWKERGSTGQAEGRAEHVFLFARAFPSRP